MNRKILGKNLIFNMMIDGIPYPIFCAKTAFLDSSQDKIEVTHVNSGPHRNWVPGMSDSQINVVGLSLLNNDEGKISPFYLQQLSVRRSINEYLITATDQDANSIAITIQAFILNVNVGKDTVAWSQASLTLQPTEEWVYSSVIPPPGTPTCEQMPTIYDELAEGSTTYINALLIPGVGETITILHVSRAGTTYYETSGTPGNLEFKYTSGTGTIEWENPGNPADPDLEQISIEYKVET